MNDLASEFFFESIRRIIPGLALIIICFQRQAESCFHMHREFFASPIFFAVCIIALAWPLGILIDTAIFLPFAVLFDLLIYCCRNCSVTRFMAKWYFLSCQTPDSKPNRSDETPYEREMRRQHYLGSMTKVMCRCMAGVCFFRVILYWFKLWISECPKDWAWTQSIWIRYLILGCCFFMVWYSNYHDQMFGNDRIVYQRWLKQNPDSKKPSRLK
jgi:hypothetical protein